MRRAGRSETSQKWRWLALVVVLMASPAEAWTATYFWAANPTATSYKVEKSVDDGLTWTVVSATLTVPTYVYTGTETGLTLFRISHCNAYGCTIRPADGLWHNEAWQPPLRPGSLAVQ